MLYFLFRFSNDGEYYIILSAAVRTRPEDGHAAARRRRVGREAQQADRQVCGQHLGHAGSAAVRHAGATRGHHHHPHSPTGSSCIPRISLLYVYNCIHSYDMFCKSVIVWAGVHPRDGCVRAARQVLGARAVGERAARGAAGLLRGRRRPARARCAARAARPGRAAPRHRQADQLQVLLLVSTHYQLQHTRFM